MKNLLGQAAAACLVFVSLAASAQQSELQQYVQACQSELGFNASDVPALKCTEGAHFAGGGFRALVNDFLIYRRLNDNVDLAAACRWVSPSSSAGAPDRAGSVELLIHNRQNGSTCFFSAKDTIVDPDTTHPVRADIVSPTNFGSGLNANGYWTQPKDLNNKRLPTNNNIRVNHPLPFPDENNTDSVRCVGCHTQGAIIASPDIVPFLAQFGLINNRRDTLINMDAQNHYHAVASNPWPNPDAVAPYATQAFKRWDRIIHDSNSYDPSDCASGCHTVGRFSTIGSLHTIAGGVDRLIPSLDLDIELLEANGMPPYVEDSDYRWINLDTPGNGVESENFADAVNESTSRAPVPGLLSSCTSPYNLEAHAVGTHGKDAFRTSDQTQIPDNLRVFNVKEGLVCMNADQNAGQSCHDYATSYLCDGEWKTPQNTDSPTFDGDHEERGRFAGLCAAPTAIKAHFSINNVAIDVIGPNDRLARFSAFGLTCNNADQPSGQCSNYVVRYRDCAEAPAPYTRQVKSTWSGTLVTATGTAPNAQTRAQPNTPAWNTQKWEIAQLPKTEYVRLRNTGTNTYLTVSSAAEQALVVSTTSSTSTAQQWVLERVKGGTDFRLKNLLSGKYLTLADTGQYSAIYSQALNYSWASQRWNIQ